MRKTSQKVVIVLTVGGIAVASLFYAFLIWSYFSTDSAYERLIRAHPSSQEEVRKILSDFKEAQVRSPGEMNPQIAKSMSGGMYYLRYEQYANGGIDVLYDRSGKVVTIWPNYE